MPDKFLKLKHELWDEDIPFIPHTKEDLETMLREIGVENIEDLLAGIPESIRLKEPLDLPPRMSEIEALLELKRLAQMNRVAICFAGGGVYDHFRPTAIDTIISRPEFYTAYTPYQPEVSQGTLQAIWEYQSLICELTGLDAANASLYCGGTAMMEAAVLAVRKTKRDRILVAESVHPHHKRLLKAYGNALPYDVLEVPVQENGIIDIPQLRKMAENDVAALIVQHPNFFGIPEEMELISEIAHTNGALFISSFDPISLGLLKSPTDYNADIAVAEGQSLGIPMSYGGPYLGVMAAKQEYIRNLPGRLSGETVDRDGRRGFVLTLQTREQHIRRAKATSNICTNQALCALTAAAFMVLMGKQGIREMAEQSLQKAHYLADRITKETDFQLRYPESPFFKEFLLTSRHEAKNLIDVLAAKRNLLLGPSLGRFYPGEEENSFLVAVTEVRTKNEMDKVVEELKTFD